MNFNVDPYIGKHICEVYIYQCIFQGNFQSLLGIFCTNNAKGGGEASTLLYLERENAPLGEF